MDFSKKCNLIFELLDCTNAEIARYANIDPSIISRFRTGKRKPRNNSSQFENFCRGVITFAKENSKLDKLQAKCNLPDINGLENELAKHLIDDISYEYKGKKEKDLLPKHNFFSEKLNIIMNTLELSNIRLAHALNIDSSLISRFKNGLRIPSKNSLIFTNMCNYFYKVFKSKGLEKELFNILDIPSILNELTQDKVIKFIEDWFFVDYKVGTSNIIESFFEKIDTLGQVNALGNSTINMSILLANQNNLLNEYNSLEGLAQAALRFLNSIVISDTPITLKLYSDQNMNWMTTTPDFIRKWSILMLCVLKKRHSIKIIHNLDRNINEMLLAIEKWLPLYLSGLIEGYYCKGSRDQRFSHTLFVAPKLAAIYGSHVFGTENDGIYQYVTEPDKIDFYERQIDAIFENSKPLIQVYNQHNSINYYSFMKDISKTSTCNKRLLLSPPIYTIPEKLFRKILHRSYISPGDMETIITTYIYLKKRFETELQHSSITDFILFPSSSTPSSNSYRLIIPDTFKEFDLYYTPKEYSEHINSLIDLLKYENYNIIPINICPFENIHIEVNENYVATVQKLFFPITVFRFNHPLMCKAISEYLDVIKQTSSFNNGNKEKIADYLYEISSKLI